MQGEAEEGGVGDRKLDGRTAHGCGHPLITPQVPVKHLLTLYQENRTWYIEKRKRLQQGRGQKRETAFGQSDKGRHDMHSGTFLTVSDP